LFWRIVATATIIGAGCDSIDRLGGVLKEVDRDI